MRGRRMVRPRRRERAEHEAYDVSKQNREQSCIFHFLSIVRCLACTCLVNAFTILSSMSGDEPFLVCSSLLGFLSTLYTKNSMFIQKKFP